MPANLLDEALTRLEPMTESASTWAIKAHLMLLDVPKSDYFAARIAKEPAIRDAISESCREWIGSRPFPRMNDEQAMFVFDRFRYAHAFAVWLIEGGMICNERNTGDLLTWLLIDSWEQVCLAQWKCDLMS